MASQPLLVVFGNLLRSMAIRGSHY
jgi:hypothetical protein